jgi:hypothetical protein
MHPTIQAEIARARIAGRQHQASRAAIAQAAIRARGGLLPPGPGQAAGLPWRVLTALATRRRPAQARPRRLPACQPLASCSTCT